MLTPYLVNAAVAAALGAGTNELAIIAILRYILPRKKSEIARRIRDIIATDLMSPDKMRDKLDDPRVGDVFRKNIDTLISELLSRDLPAPIILLASHMAEMDSIVARLRESLLNEFSRRCSSPSFATDVIHPFLAERWDVLKHRSPRSLLSAQSDSISRFVLDWVSSLEKSESLKRNVHRALATWLANRLDVAHNLAELLPSGIVAVAENVAVSQTPVIIEQLSESLREPQIRDAIAAAVMAGIEKQLSRQGIIGDIKGVFVNAMRVERDVAGICRALPDELQEHFRKPVNRDAFADTLRKAVRSSLKHDLSPDLKSPDKRESFVNLILERIWRPDIFAELGQRASSIVDEALSRSLNETVIKIGVADSRDTLLTEASERCRRILASDATRVLLEKQFDELFDAWKAKPLGKLDRFVTPDTRTRIATVAADEARNMLRLRLGDFAEEAGVWDIVTESIEGYSNKQISDLIVNLARSELRWVTILGGVIGVVVGVVQTFFQG